LSFFLLFLFEKIRYVTWEIAPGRLADGSIVDVWGRSDVVEWSMPGAGAPCTSTSRPGRWRSFPYAAGFEGEVADAVWSYLCRQWDDEHNVVKYPGRKLLKFNFFMLQADVLPQMAFSPTRKRLIQSYECVPENEEEESKIATSAELVGLRKADTRSKLNNESPSRTVGEDPQHEDQKVKDEEANPEL
jgi:hypothetical protein